uniref:Protein PRD1 n=1 Tax=Oryza punctata TaxID=4537 RepID=A0A0E0KP90_ORYPU
MESDGEDTPPAARPCGAGHQATHSLPTSAGGRVCLSCAAALLSSAATAPSHHVSHALATLSLALADPAFLAPLRAAHQRLLAAPLAEALAGAAARRDAALAAQASDLAADLAAAVGAPAASDLVARIARALSSGSLVKHLHTLHCLGILLNSTKDAAAYIGDKQSLYLNLVNDLRLPSDEIRGEILFVLYKLSLLNATPWDDRGDNNNVDLLAIGRSLLQFSLEVLLKTQNDAVRLNCVALLLTLAKKGAFDILLLSDQSLISSSEAEDNVPLNASLVILFADAVKGSLLSTNVEVQTGTLELIFHFLSSDANIFVLKTLIDQNVADYVFEVLRLSGNNDPLVIASIQVLSLLANSEERFKEKLAIAFSTLLPRYHFTQSNLKFYDLRGNGELGMSSETFALVCSMLVEILKLPSADDIQKFPAFIILRKKALEDSIIETCETYLLPWLESAIFDGNDEETLSGILQIFQIILSRTSDNKSFKFAEMLASSSWFSLSFGFMGLFPTDHVKSAVYLVISSIVDKVLGSNYGETIRDACIYLPADPAELMLAADNQILASVEQYILLNGGKFPHEIPGSLMLTLLVLLYAFVRGISFRFSIPHSTEAEKTLFHAMAHKEWNLLLIRVHLIALKWIFQNEELMEPLSFHLLNFCKTFCEDRTVMLSSSIQSLDIQMIAELVYSGETFISSLLVSLLSQMIKEGAEDDVLSVVNVITEILVTFPCTSDQFLSCGIVDALGSMYVSLCSSRIKSVCSLLIFNILHSASAMTFACDDDAWLALTMKLLDCFNSSLAYTSSEQEWKILIGILCLVLNHSANKVLIEPAKAIILNNCLVLLMDGIVQEACAKGPSLFQHNQETTFGELLILMLLLIFFSLRSLQAILEASIDWQEFLQYSDDTESSSVLGIPCHDLCRLMHFGPPPIKFIASQCLLELLTRISDQRSCLNAELRCSAKYLKSILAVTEGMVFSQDSRVAENCGACLTVILGWERCGSKEKAVISESKWSRLILEEFAVALTAPGLTSKSFSKQQKVAAKIAVSLLQLSQVPDWLTSLFSDSLISGIVANLSARNVTAEIVTLFSELMAKNYLNQEHIAGLHNLFQVCRRQAYEGGGSKAQPSEQKAEAARSADDVRALLFGMMLDHRAGSCATVEMEQQRLLREIDSFFSQESSLREQREVTQISRA